MKMIKISKNKVSKQACSIIYLFINIIIIIIHFLGLRGSKVSVEVIVQRK